MNPDSIRYRASLIGHWLAVGGILLLAVVTLPLAGLWWLLTAGGPVHWLDTWQGRVDELQLRAARARIARKAARPPSSMLGSCYHVTGDEDSPVDPRCGRCREEGELPIVMDRYGETRLSKMLRGSIRKGQHNV